MATMYYFAVPESIAAALNLKSIRSCKDGQYLLSGQDLCCYGTERAISEGAVQLTRKEAKKMFNL
jgi:hypothetical protein